MRTRTIVFMTLLMTLGLIGCQSKDASKSKVEEESASTQPAKEADYIVVQHVLIGFQGTLPGKNVTRTREEAQALAEDLLKRAQAGEDFGELVKQYTDDAYPGVYKMANFDVPGDPAQQIYERRAMVAAFGDVGFPLDVGEIGMAPYSQTSSPYGWHIIKRVK